MSNELTRTIVQDFVDSRSFPLDFFQSEAIDHIATGHNVVVSAPTGAGKTVIAEAAAELALKQGFKLFYTTPIKALSNQKFRDFSQQWGVHNVGLLTGDNAINGDAAIVVMTTEVLRNMLYSDSSTLSGLRYVVMDEVHYLSDEFRGAVWEEIILSLPEDVQLIALSATIGNTEQFGDWISTVMGDTKVVQTDFRPVPLTTNLLVGSTIYPLESSRGDFLSRHLEKRISQLSQKPYRAPRFPNRVSIVETLQRENLLPAIEFIFSRAGCDAALKQCGRSKLTLTTKEERRSILTHIDERCESLNEADRITLGFTAWRALLGRGYAAHHAGMLPLFRQVVEELFAEGLVKVVFATETLAMGINMPARAVVIEKLTKYNGVTHVELSSSQFAQLTGRAGRRGIDEEGHAVVYYSPDIELPKLWDISHGDPAPLISSFKVGYNMVVNLLSHYDLDDALDLLHQSFGQFQANQSVVESQRQLNRANRKLRKLDAKLPDGLIEYLDIVSELDLLEKQWRKDSRFHKRSSMSRKEFGKLRRGDVICVRVRRKPVLAVVLSGLYKGKVRVATSNWVGQVSLSDVRGSSHPLGKVKLPKSQDPDSSFVIKAARKGLNRSQIRIPRAARKEKAPRPPRKIAILRRELRQHPLHRSLSNSEIADLNRNRHRLIRQKTKASKTISEATSTLGAEFSAVCNILQQSGYLTDDYALTNAGELLREIYNETDFLCAELIREKIWDGLDPAELAGLFSALTGEARKDSDIAWPPSPTDSLDDALQQVQRLARDISRLEARQRLSLTRDLFGGFVTPVHQWACGAPLEHCLVVAKMAGLDISPGDFVRHIRHTVDLLAQVINLSDEISPALTDVARQAKKALQRDIVIDHF
ncbi:MAG: DEAD/DEAH box helicase [Lawsonella sp.]